jgi:DNA polymerase
MLMQSSEYSRVLHEMGVGPLWVLRRAEVTSPPEQAVPVIETASLHSEELEPAPPLAITGLVDAQTSAQTDTPRSVAASVAINEIAWPEDLSAVLPVTAMSWEELQPVVESCRACGLCQGRKKAVFGTGDRQAKWLFVGEGPGYNENLQGLPFVGAAGQLLDNMMKALGVQRGDQAYIANIVKCRPTDQQGKDRPPTADEVAACLPYLHRQIALIAPQIIVALGKTAATSLLGLDMETPVGQLRGKLHQFKGIPVVATYHPAYLLRKPADKSKAWADLCLAMTSLPLSSTS